MEVFCKKAILKTKMGSLFKKATVLRNICEPLVLYVVCFVCVCVCVYVYIYIYICLSLDLNWIVLNNAIDLTQISGVFAATL